MRYLFCNLFQRLVFSLYLLTTTETHCCSVSLNRQLYFYTEVLPIMSSICLDKLWKYHIGALEWGKTQCIGQNWRNFMFVQLMKPLVILWKVNKYKNVEAIKPIRVNTLDWLRYTAWILNILAPQQGRRNIENRTQTSVSPHWHQLVYFTRTN